MSGRGGSSRWVMACPFLMPVDPRGAGENGKDSTRVSWARWADAVPLARRDDFMPGMGRGQDWGGEFRFVRCGGKLVIPGRVNVVSEGKGTQAAPPSRLRDLGSLPSHRASM